METLQKLIDLVTHKRMKKVELFDEQSRNKNSNYFRLFEGIHTHRYSSDEDASKDIYNCDSSEKKYLILKTRLKQKLLNTLFFLDAESLDYLSKQEVAQYECNRILYHARILLMNKTYSLAIPMVEKAYKKANSAQLSQLSYDCALILAQYHSEMQNYKEFMQYQELSGKLETKFIAENRAKRFFQEIKTVYHKSKSNRELALKLAEKYKQELEKYLLDFKSPVIENQLLNIYAFVAQAEQNSALALNTLNQKEKLYENKPRFFSPQEVSFLKIDKMNTFLQLKEHEQGQSYGKSNKIFKEGEKDWYEFQLLRVLLAMQTQNYREGAAIFKDVLNQSSFRNLEEAQKDKWKTVQAYLHYVYRYKKQKGIRSLIQNSKLNFKLSEFIDDRPPFSKEQRGLNLSTLSFQILVYLEREDWKGIEDCIQSMTPYCRRYPKKDEYFRSECFINMLVEAQKEDFRYYPSNQKTEKTFHELCEVANMNSGKDSTLEVFSYEYLWETILEKLKEHRYG